MAREPGKIVLTPEQQRRRRARSIAIALALGALVILFFIVEGSGRVEPSFVSRMSAMSRAEHSPKGRRDKRSPTHILDPGRT